MVKVGDRVLQINGCSMKDASQSDALTILRGASDSVTMEIEYEAELQGNVLITSIHIPVLICFHC